MEALVADIMAAIGVILIMVMATDAGAIGVVIMVVIIPGMAEVIILHIIPVIPDIIPLITRVIPATGPHITEVIILMEREVFTTPAPGQETVPLIIIKELLLQAKEVQVQIYTVKQPEKVLPGLQIIKEIADRAAAQEIITEVLQTTKVIQETITGAAGVLHQVITEAILPCNALQVRA